jgi:hypothetical protein
MTFETKVSGLWPNSEDGSVNVAGSSASDDDPMIAADLGSGSTTGNGCPAASEGPAAMAPDTEVRIGTF